MAKYLLQLARPSCRPSLCLQPFHGRHLHLPFPPLEERWDPAQGAAVGQADTAQEEEADLAPLAVEDIVLVHPAVVDIVLEEEDTLDLQVVVVDTLAVVAEARHKPAEHLDHRGEDNHRLEEGAPHK